MSWKFDSGHEDLPVIDYIDALFGYAMVLTRNRSEAEELVQETYLRAIKTIEDLQVGSNTKSWLITTLRTIWLNQSRKQRGTPKTFDIDDGESTANSIVESLKDPCATYMSNVECEKVRKAIRQLPVAFREVIHLHEYEDLSYKQMAYVLDCPIGTVVYRLARAHFSLRTLLSITQQRLADEMTMDGPTSCDSRETAG